MAVSSHKRMSLRSLYRDRSIRLKILFAFLIILVILIGQYLTSQNSLNNYETTFDKGLTDLNNAYGSLSSDAAIRDSLGNLKALIRNEQTNFLSYVYKDYTGENFGGNHDNLQYQITSEFTKITNYINGLPDYIDKTNGLDIVQSMSDTNTQIKTTLDIGYSVFPVSLSNTMISALTSLDSLANSKFNNVLFWMYTNNTDYFTTANAPLSSIGTEFQDTTANLQTLLKSDKTKVVPYNANYTDLTSLFNNIDANITDFETVVGTNAGNPVLVDQTALTPIIANISNYLTSIQGIKENTIGSLNLEIANITSLLTSLTTPNTGDFAHFSTEVSNMNTWTQAVDSQLQAQFDAVRNNVNQKNADTSNQQNQYLIVFLILSAIVIIGVQLLINFDITEPIQTISKWSEQIAKGDLSRTPSSEPMERQDEIGRLHNNFWGMNLFLRNIIRAVRESSELITVTADDLSSNTMEINSTAEEVSAIAQSMAKGSTSQAEVITDIVHELQLTSEIVDNVINQINYNLRIIHDLSEQTNVLALNTAIEAANAGEFGRGFGVISESIRKMAVQSKKTTSDVTKDSRDILIQLRQTFSSISQKIENVASVSEETAASAEEVAASAEELTAVIEEIAARATALTDRSHGFEELVNRFMLSPTFESPKPMEVVEMEKPVEKEPVMASPKEEKTDEKPKQKAETDSEIEEKSGDTETESLKKLQDVDMDNILENNENNDSSEK